MGIKRDFIDDYVGKVGLIEGGNGRTVKVTKVALSTFTSPEWHQRTFGCPQGQFAVLVTYQPERLPAGAKLVVFPKIYDDVPVYYAPGTA